MNPRELGNFCLDCHWDTFDDKMSIPPPDQWHCNELHRPGDLNCDVDEACCNNDTCSFNCSSVCDGFVDCEISSTLCSDANCEEAHCENAESPCFEKSCFGDGNSVNQSITDLFHDATLHWDAAAFFPPIVNQHPTSAAESQLFSQSPTGGHHNNTHFQLPDSHCHESTHNAQHHPCHQAPEDCMGLWTPADSGQHDFGHVDMPHELCNSSPFDTNQSQEMFSQASDLSKLPCFQNDGALSCSDAGFQHLGCYLRNSGDTGLQQFSRTQSHSRVHRHSHNQSHHRVSHYSRHNTRRSVSAQLLADPIDSPPSLDRNTPSALTSPVPKSVVDEDESYVCRWNNGKGACGSIFLTSGELQQHLLTVHTNLISGKRGNGYYCCWQGCHRPDEPFSQKSKLQGHFLTHSNYKNFSCSVCGKAFARQATLERHERSHRGEKPFTCKVCGKAFTDSSELKTHSRTHTGEKPFKCNFPGCNFQTGDSSNMSSHKLTHNGRQHKCTFPGCSKSFTRPDQLKRHLKTTHKVDNPPTELSLPLLSPPQAVY
ncbi:putative C2H2 transcription factor [Talaromyces proteolyticus]|uniref:C2H2 transcription factor n=1 Tax=Talaromyces proteolyticus TaxID=1131652 RepID=A0AAD4PXK2_9EURO|nr:putative C2H2 transcription factor [Talaromyces proteolyticus]KAH8693226.1 putative C2H2 transcription factor [Talaromyces proteolyticus]